MDKYRYIKFDELTSGLKCQTCYQFFTDDNKWVDIEITDEFLNKYLGLIKSDAYETEFRVKID